MFPVDGEDVSGGKDVQYVDGIPILAKGEEKKLGSGIKGLDFSDHGIGEDHASHLRDF
jgi:hypothetical protein